MDDEAKLLKKAYDTNLALLDAEKLEVRVLDDGTVVTVPVPDNQTRQRATESAFDLVGAKQNTREPHTDNGPGLTLVLPNYYSQEFLEREKRVINMVTVNPEDDLSGPTGGTSLREDHVEDVEPEVPVQLGEPIEVAPSSPGE